MTYETYLPEGEPAAAAFPRLAVSGDYTDVVVAYNPAGRRRHEVDDVVRSFEAGRRAHGLTVHKVATSLEPAVNMALLSELPPSALLALWAGDGGANKPLRAAHDLRLTNPIIILPGGTKNDLALQTAPRRLLADPSALLEQAHLGPLAPIELMLRPVATNGANETQQPALPLKAFAYASQGVSGQVGHDVNAPEYRDKAAERDPATRRGRIATYAAEHALATRDFFGAQPFMADGRRHVDIIWGNGSRMAGGAMKLAADLFRPEAQLIAVRNRTLGAVVLGALSMGGPASHWVGEMFDTTANTVRIANEQPIYFQIDGDEFPLEGIFDVEYLVATHALNIITNRQQ